MSGEKSEEVEVQPVVAEDTEQAPPSVDKVDVDVEKERRVNTTLEKHAHDQDEAMKAVDEMDGDLVEVDEQTSKRLLRTIDRHLMPIMCMVYAMNYLDSMLQTLWTE